jgi:putative transposase
MDVVETSVVVNLFKQVAPARYWLALGRRSRFRRRGIFCLPLVIWMMIMQRLDSNSSLAAAVRQLRAGSCRSLLRRCKRVREGRISAATGGYCQARQKLSKRIASQIMDDFFQRLETILREGQPGLGRPVFLLDGTTLQLEHTPELKAAYPPASNQHGVSHWPTLRVAVAHDVESGLAVRPAWGPQTTSEQKLIEEVIARLPPAAVVMGDRNFGVFSVAWAAQQQAHPVLLRLNTATASKLLGGKLEAGIDQPVVWKPSAWERGKHPEIPKVATVGGRVIVYELKGEREPFLCLFTTLETPAHEAAQTYALRWNIETDLRSLKRTVKLHHLSARSLAMMEKELLLAMVAYNLVRTIICLAARKAGLAPRQISFTAVYHLIEVHLPRLLQARSRKRWEREMDTIVEYAAAYKLPQRKKQRSYPRAVWGTGYRFPLRKTHEQTK